jgi:hypothetical protein
VDEALAGVFWPPRKYQQQSQRRTLWNEYYIAAKQPFTTIISDSVNSEEYVEDELEETVADALVQPYLVRLSPLLRQMFNLCLQPCFIPSNEELSVTEESASVVEDEDDEFDLAVEVRDPEVLDEHDEEEEHVDEVDPEKIVELSQYPFLPIPSVTQVRINIHLV